MNVRNKLNFIGTGLTPAVPAVPPAPHSNGKRNGQGWMTSALPAARPRPVASDPPRMIQREIRDDQICVLTFDRPGSAANIFDTRTLTELGEELDFVASFPHLKGLVLASAKPSIFIAGVDLNTMTRGDSFEEVQKLIELGQSVIHRVATLAIPTVAAIHGVAVGGGYEICLACDYRIASTDRVTKVGLPETQLGLLPAWGGATRLPRLIGLPKALDVILGGKTLAAKQALKYGMVDELAPAEYLLQVAAQRIGRGKPKREQHLAANNRLVAAVLAWRVRGQLRAKARGNYPAIPKALEVMAQGVSKSVPQSLALEREGIGELIQTAACRNLIRVFFLQERAKKLTLPGVPSTGTHPGYASILSLSSPKGGEGRGEEVKGSQTQFPSPQPSPRSGGERELSLPAAAVPKPVKRTAVIGAGVMGAGIAQWLSARGLPVVLRDLGTEQVAGGMATIGRLYKESLKRRILTPCEARAGMDRIYPAPSEVPLRQVDLVIEAAVEKLEAKKNIFRRLDELAGEDTLLATNTSALPISELAAGTRRPERVLGLHFFNPVHRMQLVEIIAARQTSPEALRRALRFVQQIGKQPVVVKDSPGFLVNRILMPYLLEAGNLFEAGANLKSLDEAMLDFGMPMGPMRLLDEVGLDVALHVAQTLAASFGNRMAVPELLSKMIQAGFLGRKNGRGFYIHDGKAKEPHPNANATGFARSQAAAGLSHAALQERMALLMINESARCLEEEIVSDPADVDFAMIMGTGFAPFRGGPLRYADALGAAKVTGAMARLVEGGAAHFGPCGLLRDMAASGKSFYERGQR